MLHGGRFSTRLLLNAFSVFVVERLAFGVANFFCTTAVCAAGDDQSNLLNDSRYYGLLILIDAIKPGDYLIDCPSIHYCSLYSLKVL
jgi:hypothetical protein